jgi:hypothetical protein
MPYIKDEPQAMVRTHAPISKTLSTGDNTWMKEQSHILDPVTLLDVVVRGSDFDSYFYYVILLLFFGMLLM